MRLSQTAEYALRTMAQLAIDESGAPVRAKDLAESTEIPVHYLSKLLRRLVVAGLLKSERGHGGGFALAKPPGRIRIVDILAAVDAVSSEPRCVFGWSECSDDNPCPLHPVWSQLRESFDAWASRRTLADLRRAWVGYGNVSDRDRRR